jgi:uncharacterized membrane protein YdbT with pleckstrin-like domain
MPGDINRVLEILRKSHLFMGLEDAHLVRIAGMFEVVYVKPGTKIIAQGQPADAFYLIYRGSVKVLRRRRGEDRQLARLVPGDYFGERGLIFGLARNASVIANGAPPIVLFKMDREKFMRLLREFPDVGRNLRLIANSRSLSAYVNFNWLDKEHDETIYLIQRKHIAFLFFRLIPVLILGLGLSGVSFWLGLEFTMSLPTIIGAGILFLVLLAAGWIILDWSNDYYIVTNQRIIWLEKIIGFYDSRQESPMRAILSLGIETDQIARWLGYGNVIIRTFTGQIVMRDVAYPASIRNLVDEHWGRSKQQASEEQKEATRQAIRSTVRQVITQQKPAGSRPGGAAGKPSGWEKETRFSLLEDLFKMRYEQGDAVTYRKHWVILLKGILLPSLLILALFIVVILGWLNPVVGFTFIIGCGLWWLYNYVDWRNDIYRVTNDKIYDIDKKPLGTEHRKEAPLDNVLSLEVELASFIRILLNYGNVIVDVSGSKFTFDDIFDPRHAQQDIFQRMEAYKRKKAEDQEGRERSRQAEWIEIYHQEATKQQDSGPAKA